MITIRPAQIRDAIPISQMITNAVHLFTDPDCADTDTFLQSVTPAAIAACIMSQRYNYLVASVDAELAGVIAMRDNSHLHHLFVAPAYQGRKIAQTMWQFALANALEAGASGAFTAYVTPGAVKAHERFGFTVCGERFTSSGIVLIPMCRNQHDQTSSRAAPRVFRPMEPRKPNQHIH